MTNRLEDDVAQTVRKLQDQPGPDTYARSPTRDAQNVLYAFEKIGLAAANEIAQERAKFQKAYEELNGKLQRLEAAIVEYTETAKQDVLGFVNEMTDFVDRKESKAHMVQSEDMSSPPTPTFMLRKLRALR